MNPSHPERPRSSGMAQRPTRGAAAVVTLLGVIGLIAPGCRDGRPSPGAFTAVSGGFTADEASFTAEGARLDLRSGLEIRTRGLGRAAHTSPTRFGAPVVERCPAGVACDERLVYRAPDLSEWWIALPGAFEQGWIVAARPGGAGPLRVELSVEGAAARVEAGAIVLEGDAMWRVDQLAAADASGRPLKAWFEATGGGFAVVVDDADARYPIEIDPMYTTASVELLYRQDGFSTGMTLAGDLNGDGFDDLAISSPHRAWGPGYGELSLYFGSPAGVAANRDALIPGPASAVNFGSALRSAGDVDADGYADLLVGAQGVVTGDLGQALVYHGSAAGLESTPRTQIVGARRDFAELVVGGVDFNGDGFDDIAVGDWTASSTGEVLIYAGSPAGVSTTASQTLSGVSSGRHFGDHGDGGDVNGDGYADLVVGAEDAGSYGEAYVFLGSSAGLASSPAQTLSGHEYAAIGGQLAVVGDVDADGFADVTFYREDRTEYAHLFETFGGSASGLESAPMSAEGTLATAGSARVVGLGDIDGDGFGDAALGELELMSIFTGSRQGLVATTVSYTAFNAVGGGDLNADGLADLVFAHDGGHVEVHHGQSGGLDAVPDQFIDDGINPNYFGVSVAGGADFNADGVADVVVGSIGRSGPTGRALVYSPLSGGTLAEPTYILSGESTSTHLRTVAVAGDPNGDGYADLLVGMGIEDSFTIYWGSATGLSSAASTLVTGPAATGHGLVLDGVGDVDGDGFDEVLVVGSRVVGGQGAVYYGDPTGLSAANAAWISSPQASNTLWGAASGAGDLNADGYADFIVGGRRGGGGAWIFLGSASGAPGTPSIALRSPMRGAEFGAVAEGLGDVNGDGFSDVGVGAPNMPTGGVEPGAVFVYAGDASGLDTSGLDTLGSDLTRNLGTSLAALGDLDGDGFDDFAVGGSSVWLGTYLSTSAASVEVWVGGASGLFHARTMSVTLPHDEAASTLAGAGDVNADGLPDLIVGNWAAERAWIFYGSGNEDEDGDGFLRPTDCNDWDSSIHPNAAELCDPNDIDEDCDGLADDADPNATGGRDAYDDRDGDGFGGQLIATQCERIAGAVNRGGDCDDADPAIHVGAAEVCDPANLDQDCDGLADDDDPGVVLVGAAVWYPDRDRDGYGESSQGLAACDNPGDSALAYVPQPGDCDEASPFVNPGAPEVCDAQHRDDDCDGLFDEPGALGEAPYYADADGDGFGGAALGLGCAPPEGAARLSGDCDDARSEVNPGQPETCAAGDEDCDGLADDADPGLVVPDGPVWYFDDDGDGYGISELSRQFCDEGAASSASFAPVDADCDDGDAGRNPAAVERCDGLDNDCDGLVDEDEAQYLVWYPDADGDGRTSAEGSVRACAPPDGYKAASLRPDCDDNDPEVHPNAEEVPGDGVDQDCDGQDSAAKSPTCGFNGGAPAIGLALTLAALTGRRRVAG